MPTSRSSISAATDHDGYASAMASGKGAPAATGDVHRKVAALLKRQQRSFKAVCTLVASLPHVDFQVGMYRNTILQTVIDAAAEEERKDARNGRHPPPPELVKRRRFVAQLVTHLLADGASVDLADESGSTALYYAADGDVGIIEILLAHGADPSARPGTITPLMRACMAPRPRVENVRALLEAGADPNARLDSGETASALCREPGIAALLERYGGAPPIEASRDPARDARAGNVEALRAMADNNARTANDAIAYKWLCVAVDHGHERAARAAADVLEQTSLRYDDDHVIQAQTHWELACSYFDGSEGLAQNNVRAAEHVRTAADLLGDRFEKVCKPEALAARLPPAARTALDRCLAARSAHSSRAATVTQNRSTARQRVATRRRR